DKLNKHAELGIAIGDKNYWGKGYGLSALKEMLARGFNELDLNKIWLRVEVDNVRAIKNSVLESKIKCCMQNLKMGKCKNNFVVNNVGRFLLPRLYLDAKQK
ncbi:MAG: GNAT family protein, partial [Alphaproteobacteria bacterium]|nr:GNAT family protein [Alphaproteobacteria bacterium]